MEAKDTVMKAGDLCRLACSDTRQSTGEAKNCELNEDCEACQLNKQAELSFKAGIREVVEWMDKHDVIGFCYDADEETQRQYMIEWSTKLKVWGIDEYI